MPSQTLVNEHFASTASRWKEVYQETTLSARIYQQRRAVALHWIKHLGLPRTAHLLEVGCGAGLTTVELAQHGFEIEALDTVPGMLDLTRHHLVETGTEGRVRTICADVRHLPFPDNNFDLVFALGVVMWVDTPFRAIQQIARVTRPGGYVLITADHRPNLVELLDPWRMPLPLRVRRSFGSMLARLKLWRRGPGPRVHRHSLREFDSMILDAGLSKVSGVTLGFGPFTLFGRELVPDSIGKKVHQFLQTAANRGVPIIRSAGAQYIVFAKKGG